MRSSLKLVSGILLVVVTTGACSLPLTQVAPRRSYAPATDPAAADAAASSEGAVEDTSSGLDEDVGIVELSDVLSSVDTKLPLLLAAQTELERVEGELLAARGGFDPVLRGGSRFDVQGFYESERVDLEVEQPTTLWGASLFSGYRLGRGSFAVYDGKAETNDGGEVRVGARLPLFQGREIDKRRAELWKARIARDRADPVVAAKRLEMQRKAALAYWKWRAAGEKLRVVSELLALARTRQRSLASSVAEGLLPEIVLVDNERLVVEREALEIAAQRAFERAAFGLSLYLRDRVGDPVRPDLDRVADGFPLPRPGEVSPSAGEAVAIALERRPELTSIGLETSAARLQLALENNRRSPELNLEVFASQDVGAASSSKRDKGPFEVGVGLSLEFPLLVREARGRVRTTKAEIERLTQEARWLRDRIEAEVRDAASALRRARERIDKAERAVALARRMEEAELDQLEAGNSDLLRVNLREERRASDVANWVEAQAEYFVALASYSLAMALPVETFSRVDDSAPESSES